MPFGLIHHNLEFFAKENPANVYPIDHYAVWQTTMFSHFGHKWDRLFRGPMWSYDGGTSEEEELSAGDSVTSDVEAVTPELDVLSQAVNVTEGFAELMTGGDENAQFEEAAPCPKISSLFSGLSTSDRVDLEQAAVLPQQI